MRTKNAIQNLMISLLYEMFILALGLIVPRFIILSYGDSINGLTQTINRLLTLVNLLQAGAVGASIFQMFKPVAEDNYEIQSAILYASKKFFNKMGAFYLIIVMFCAIFYALYLQEENLTPTEIILSFAVLSLNGSLYFFFTARHDIICTSYQKKYLIKLSSFIEKIVYYILLFFVIKGNLYFVFMYVALLCGSVVRVLVNEYYCQKLVGKRLTKKPTNKKYEIKDRKYLMLASIGDQTIAAAPTVIITTLISLASSSVFSVYSMVYISMKTLIDSVHHSISAIFGNLVTTANNKKIAIIFNVLLYVFVVIGTTLASCCAFLFMRFIPLYTKGFATINYEQPILACFIVAYVAIFAVKTVFYFVSNSYGLFRLTCKVTLVCGGISLIVSVISTMLFGMPYVMVGVLLYHFSTMCVFIVAFNKEISWFVIDKKWIPRIIIIGLLPLLSWWLYKANVFFISGWLGWFVMAIIYGILIIGLLLIYSLIFEKEEFLLLLEYMKTGLKKKKNLQGC